MKKKRKNKATVLTISFNKDYAWIAEKIRDESYKRYETVSAYVCPILDKVFTDMEGAPIKEEVEEAVIEKPDYSDLSLADQIRITNKNNH